MSTTYRFEDVLSAMRQYNQFAAPGSECVAWQDFVSDFYQEGHDFDELDDYCDSEFAKYWLLVSEGNNPFYEYKTGNRDLSSL